MAAVGFGTAEVVFGAKGEYWLVMGKLWQDPVCIWCLQDVPQHTDTEQRSCSLVFSASGTKALCHLFSGMTLATIMLQSWSHSVVLLPQAPLMGNEGFRWSGKMPPSHLSCSLVC